MYEVLPTENRTEMTREQITERYDGRWVFLIRVSESPYLAIPVVVADAPYEGKEQGIYTAIKAEARANNQITSCISLLHGTTSISGLQVFA